MFSPSSLSPGNTGFGVITLPSGFFPQTHTGKSGGQVQGLSYRLNARFTIRSSSEWNVMTQILPPGERRPTIISRLFSSASSSPFSSIRIAWNVRFSGCPPAARAFLGMADQTAADRSPAVSSGAPSLRLMISRAMFLAYRSSP